MRQTEITVTNMQHFQMTIPFFKFQKSASETHPHLVNQKTFHQQTHEHKLANNRYMPPVPDVPTSRMGDSLGPHIIVGPSEQQKMNWRIFLWLSPF